MTLDNKDIREMFADDLEADRRNREDALFDLRMVAGDQWDNEIGRRRDDSLPKVTTNILKTLTKAVIGDFRQEKRGVKFEPVDGGADRDLADIRNGLYRAIHRQSHGDHVFAYAFTCAVQCGIGHFRIDHDYPSWDAFDQEIFLEPVYNPLSVVWDHRATHITRKDARHCFVFEEMSREDAEKMAVDVGATDFSRDYLIQGEPQWHDGKSVKVAELFVKSDKPAELAKLKGGEVIDLTDFDDSQRKLLDIVGTRKTTKTIVQKYLVAGGGILKGPMEWSTPDIPIVPMIGEEIYVGKELVRTGAIRDARDTQIVRNLMHSYSVEMFAKMPKEPGLISSKAIEGYEGQYKGWRVFNADGDQPNPTFSDRSMIAASQELQRSDEAVRSVTGVYEAKLGERSNEQSGRAINARAAQTDALNAVYMDNAMASISHAGKIISDLIPQIYVGERVARIVGVDNSQKTVELNRKITVGGKEMPVNDLSIGRYDVYPSSGPSYTSQRQEAREIVLELVRVYPQVAQVAPDLIVKLIDGPSDVMDELVDRLAKSLPPELRPEEEPSKEQQEAMKAAQEVKKRLEAAALAKAEGEAESVQAQAVEREASAALKLSQANQPKT